MLNGKRRGSGSCPCRYTSTVAKMGISPRNEESRIADLRLGIVCGIRHEHADAPHAPGLLRSRRERPSRRRAADKRYELAALHSITSSARASSVGGTSRPSALAVLRLIVSTYLVGACTGRSDQLFTWRRLVAQGSLTAAGSGEEVVPVRTCD